MKQEMTSPCEHCPFRNDLPEGYLGPERIQEIASSLFRGESFPCHQTTESAEDEDGFSDRVASSDSQQCAGAEIFLLKQGMSTQLGRIAARLGLAAELDMDSPVCGSVREMLIAHGHGEATEVEPCHVANAGCEAPAGMLIQGGVVDGTEAAEHTCDGCGEAVCANCSETRNGERFCAYCLEWEENDDSGEKSVAGEDTGE